MHFQITKRRVLRVVFSTICVLILSACAGGLGWNSQLYRVYKNDTLYAIAWRYGLDYRDLARWNNISPPYVIHPGQELILVDPATLPEHRRPSQQKPDSQVAVVRPEMPEKEPKEVGRPVVEVAPPGKFVWPAKGKVIRTFEGSTSVARGTDIEGIYGRLDEVGTQGIPDQYGRVTQ